MILKSTTQQPLNFKWIRPNDIPENSIWLIWVKLKKRLNGRKKVNMTFFFSGCIDHASTTANRSADSHAAAGPEDKHSHTEGADIKEYTIIATIMFLHCSLNSHSYIVI